MTTKQEEIDKFFAREAAKEAAAAAQEPATPAQGELEKCQQRASNYLEDIRKVEQERDQARADLQSAIDYIIELEEFKREAVKTSERQLVTFQTERGIAMEKESEIRKLRAQMADLRAAAKNAADKWECSKGNEAAIAFADLRHAIARAEKA